MIQETIAARELLKDRSQVEGLQHAAFQLFGNKGFSAFACSFTDKPPEKKNPVLLFMGWPEAWTKRYLSKAYYAEDPILCRARTSLEAFSFSELQKDRLTALQRTIMRERQMHVGNDGLCLPVESEEGRRGVVILCGSRDAVEAADRRELQLIAMILFECACAFSHAGEAPLTKRETEVLAAAADGFTSKEIAQKLTVSVRTVNTHFENAAKKLGKSNRIKTVVTAMRLGIIR